MPSYLQIIKTTGLISVTQFLVVLLSIVRSKFMAVWVGPTGLGLLGLYTSIFEMVSALTGFGLSNSGVRQIAQAVGSGNQTYAAKCLLILRRAVVLTSLVGALLCFIFSRSISELVFGTQDMSWGVALLSLAVFFNGISFGQQAVLTGYRQIRSLAMCRTIGGILGTVATCVLIYYFRDNGIISSLVAIAFFGILTSWWYARKIRLEKVSVSRSEALSEMKALFGLGVAFSIAGLFGYAANYVFRVYIRNQLGLDAVGIFQAGWTISNFYVGTILGAMGVDFLPRISQFADRHQEMNRLVNDQMELGLLLATISVIAGVVFAPAVLHVFYSDKFKIGESMLRWQFLGVGLRVLGWPMAYVLVAKAKGKIYVSIQGIFYAMNILFMVVFIHLWGFKGLGIDYLLAYLGYTLMMAIACRRVSGFTPSPLLKRIMALSFILQTGTTLAIFLLPVMWGILIGTGALTGCIIWSSRLLKWEMGIDPISILRQKLCRVSHA